MKDNISKGKIGEYLAVKHLLNNGYNIMDRRFRGRKGEIDIIAEKDSVIAFIEVKARTGPGCGLPAESVTQAKQCNLLQTAELYIHKHNLHDKQVRMDVIEVYLNNKLVNHIEDAFGY